MDAGNRGIILKILNACWKLEVMPDELELADVVTLYKKGNVEDPGNYRPISLLQSLYKLYASLIQVRLANVVDDIIWATQYGFRRKKSTADAIYLVRRTNDK